MLEHYRGLWNITSAHQEEVVSRVMRKIDYGSGRNLLQGEA